MELDFDNPPDDPVDVLQAWIERAAATGLTNPHAMTLATVDPDQGPSARTVLLKGIDRDGAVFYTNRHSRKGRALDAHPRAALLFYWDALARQAAIEGRVSAVGDAESDAYFATRPRLSQLSAWASRQSEPVSSRAALEAQLAEVQARYDGRDVPRPPHWGGYRVSLDRIEFWQGREGRLHDRIVYEPATGVVGVGAWRTTRLSP